MYVVVFYKNGVLVDEIKRKTRDAAELVALGGLRFGAEVSIYTPSGRVLKAWNHRTS
jgi:hypothetical protein